MVGTKAYSAAEVADALLRAHGIKTAAAQIVGCSVDTIERYIRQFPTVEAAFKQSRAGIVDAAESVLVRRIAAGEWDSAKFVLTTIGRDRGWVVKQEHEHSGQGGGPLTIRVIYGDDGTGSPPAETDTDSGGVP